MNNILHGNIFNFFSKKGRIHFSLQITINCLLLAFITLMLGNYIYAIILVIPIVLLYFKFDKHLLVVLSLVSLLTVTSRLGVELRLAIQIMSYSVLIFLFLVNYGLDYNNFPTLPKELKVFFVFLYSTIIVSFIFSAYQDASWIFIARLSLFFVVVYLVYSTLTSYESIKVLLLILFIVASVVSLGIFIDLAQSGFIFLDFAKATYFRSGGLIANVNAAGGLLAITVPLALIIMLIERKLKHRIIASVLVFILGIGIILSMSRAAYISIIISVLFILFKLRRNIFNNLIVFLFILLFLSLIIPPLNEIVTFYFRVGDGLSNREYLWAMTIDIIRDYWIIGVGPGAYGQVMFKYFPVMLGSWQGIIFKDLFIVTEAGNVSHNFYLGFWAEMGIPGLISSIILPIVYLRMAFSTMNRYKLVNLKLYSLLVGITSIGLGMFTRAHLDNVNIITNGFITTDLPFWIIFGILSFLFLKTENVKNKFRD